MGEDEAVRIGTAEREQAMGLLSRQFSEGRLNPDAERPRDWRAVVMALVPLIALAFTILVPYGWLTWLAVPVLGMLLYGRR